MKQSLHILLLLWLAIVGMAGLTACSKDHAAGGDDVVVIDHASFKISLHATASGARTRGENPSAGDGWKGADEEEYRVRNATLFFYKASQGVNAPADTKILFKVYFPSFGKDTQATTSPTDVCYTSEVVKTDLSVEAGSYRVVAVCNLGNVKDKASTLGDLQQWETKQVVTGTETEVGECYNFAMSSSDDTPVTINGTTNMADEPNGSLTELSLNVQRLAARIDWSPGKGSWVENKTIVYDANGDAVLRNCYEFEVEDAPDDRFYLTSVTPVNLSANSEYVLKRVTVDNTLTNGVTYLGRELTGSDNNASNYVVDPLTSQKTQGTNPLTLSYTNPCAAWLNDFDANNDDYPVTHVADGEDNCYSDNSLTYRKLCYARENTIPVGANKQQYVTGLVFTGYYLKSGSTVAVKKTYVYYIRHTDPSGSASDALIMKYGIVRNHLYQVCVSKVASLGIIVLEVRDWVPDVAPDIDL